MPAKRLSMRKIKDVLRLCWGQGLSKRKAARSCGVSRPAVDEYLRRAEAAGLCWPLPAGLDDGALDRLLHHATTLNIKGESYRLKEKRKAGLLGRAPVMMTCPR